MKLVPSFSHPQLNHQVHQVYNELSLLILSHPKYAHVLRENPITIKVEPFMEARLAGQANSFKNQCSIRLNAMILNDYQKVRQTVAHELAHIIADRFNNSNNTHGPIWKEVMRILKASSEEFHNW